MQILFVCSGNICRSPFAEALGRQISRDSTQTFLSAGTVALAGDPAARTGIAVADESFEIDLREHRARELTAEVLATADIVYAMEEAHLTAVLELSPNANVKLLSPDGRPIPDPYGGDENTYRDSYSRIRRALDSRLNQGPKRL